MNKITIFIIAFLICEVVVAFGFSLIAQVFYKKIGLDFKSILKGVIERIFLTVCLCNDIQQGLTFFSALKLATRLKRQEENSDRDTAAGNENRFNDYYLIGNFVSVLLSVAYMWAFLHLEEWLPLK